MSKQKSADHPPKRSFHLIFQAGNSAFLRLPLFFPVVGTVKVFGRYIDRLTKAPNGPISSPQDTRGYCKLESYVHFLVPDNTIVLRFPDNIRHCLYTFYLGGIHPTRSWFSESQASHLLPMKFLRWDFGFRKNYFPNQKGFVLMCFPVWCYFHFYTLLCHWRRENLFEFF